MRDGQASAPAVAAAVKVMNALRDRSPQWLSLSELARGAGVNKASAFRILATLKAANFVIRHPQERTYALGPALIELGAAAAGEGVVLEIVRGVLPELAEETGMSAEALRAIPDGRLTVVAGLTGPGPFALNRAVGSNVVLTPAYAALQFAWCGQAHLRRLAEVSEAIANWREDPELGADVTRARAHGFVWSITVGGESDLAEVERWMEAAAALGYGREGAPGRKALLEQFVRFSSAPADTRSPPRLSPLPVLGVAAPVFDAVAEPTLQLCVVSLLAQVAPHGLAQIGAAVARKADEITAAVGGRFPAAGRGTPA
ncbi:MAG: helix-turn-helix domain-containing protein [Caulobacteraceae bacterium]|nr:helix-turn-helix domain-containing protein [Caulobacteraceae bacterium]